MALRRALSQRLLTAFWQGSPEYWPGTQRCLTAIPGVDPVQVQQQRSFATADFSFTPPGRNHLFVPGPVNIHDSVLRAMDRPSLNHRDPWFNAFFKDILEESKMIFKTKEGTTFIFPGTGTGGWEAALTNTLSPGDKVVTFRYGQFSHLWVDMMERLGLDVIVVDRPWGEGADEAKLAEILKADTKKEIKAVAVVHNETTTGVTSDIGQCRQVMDQADHPALLLVDGVSSIGALDFRMDEWGVDVAVTGSQKALSLPTGLAVVAASPKALAARKSAKSKRCYYDFEDMLKTNPGGNVPYTPSIPLLYGLRESLALLKSEGFENVIKRHHRLAEGTRRAVAGWGLKLLCKEPRWNSDSLTVIETPEGIDSGEIVKAAYTRYNLSIGVGLSKVAGKVFRIGHLGNSDEVMMLGAIAGTEMALLDAGVNIEPGSGVKEAIKYWQSTSKVIPTRG
ncbi:hypothetical protein WJX72_001909 [[Myrmecia] bisecta]|uniref:Aminotransferase class V domain-containing protein n=1 Tax=[Myrmecia] bisecta TaxID=41462 RepID=A0AAW1R524_9CHLO